MNVKECNRKEKENILSKKGNKIEEIRIRCYHLAVSVGRIYKKYW